MAQEAQRVRAVFFGHVQGVGFRFTTLDIAERFPAITGFVRNLPDGSVELVAEGPSKELADFLAAVKSAMASYIHSCQISRSGATGEFRSFSIAR